MAEGILRAAAGALRCLQRRLEAQGRSPPPGIEALKEIGYDASGHSSDHLDQYLDAGITP